jgi:uncharacterized protein
MNSLPSYDEIVALHKKHAPSDEAFDLVFTHCEIVWEIAKQLAVHGDLDIDHNRLMAGCLLHDIGVYRLYLPDGTIDHGSYIKHGILGHELLLEEGFDEDFCRFASCHTGVGLSRDDVVDQKLPLPPRDYRPHTTEERLLTYADKFHSKTTPPTFLSIEAVRALLQRFGEDKVVRLQVYVDEFGVPDLQPLAEQYKFEIT